ncbi:hypothetical protein VC34_04365 [Pseudomonas fluorescens]|uniref:Methyltransferase domain-containing protein n=2 Tax=Pseudomonas fluorescens TaxID=294 RepID=A0A0F4TT50_PSEFL|nr:hypothetical protein VC34_04365 [Pseudomonas fluorescens]
MQQHLWLTYSWKKEDYLPSECYDLPLKPYASGYGMTFRSLRSISSPLPYPGQVLELGCSTGRATAHCCRVFSRAAHTLLDLSKLMIAVTKSIFPGAASRFICQDSLAYMRNRNDVFDLVSSLRRFSHSVHQTMELFPDKGSDFSPIEEFCASSIAPICA